MKVEVRLEGFEGAIDALQALPVEVVSGRGGGVIARALRAGAKVFSKQAEANLEHATQTAPPSSEKKLSTGFLRKNIIVSRGKHMRTINGERMFVRVKRKAYPGREEVSALKTGNLLEFGSSQQPAEPWMGPAYRARAREAIATVERETLEGIKRAERKVARAARRAPPTVIK